jgi:hypothetical protein
VCAIQPSSLGCDSRRGPPSRDAEERQPCLELVSGDHLNAPPLPSVDDFIGAVGPMCMGRTTYEWMLQRHPDLLTGPEQWREFYGDRPAWVFTRSPSALGSLGFGALPGHAGRPRGLRLVAFLEDARAHERYPYPCQATIAALTGRAVLIGMVLGFAGSSALAAAGTITSSTPSSYAASISASSNPSGSGMNRSKVP